MTKNITRVVVKLLLKNDLPIIKNHLRTTNIKTKWNFQRNLKTTNNNSEIAWKIVRRCAPVNRAILRYNLCLNEKLEIATHQARKLPNKRSELVSKCKHFSKFTNELRA